MCKRRVYDGSVRINGTGSVRGEVEWRWVRGVMEVGESFELLTAM